MWTLAGHKNPEARWQNAGRAFVGVLLCGLAILRVPVLQATKCVDISGQVVTPWGATTNGHKNPEARWQNVGHVFVVQLQVWASSF